jgi:glycine betaine/choline ABC-type transport system substrate-binding protein
VVREDTFTRHPEVQDALKDLTGKISTDEMQKMNNAVDGQHRDATDVAREFLRSKGLD